MNGGRCYREVSSTRLKEGQNTVQRGYHRVHAALHCLLFSEQIEHDIGLDYLPHTVLQTGISGCIWSGSVTKVGNEDVLEADKRSGEIFVPGFGVRALGTIHVAAIAGILCAG